MSPKTSHALDNIALPPLSSLEFPRTLEPLPKTLDGNGDTLEYVDKFVEGFFVEDSNQIEVLRRLFYQRPEIKLAVLDILIREQCWFLAAAPADSKSNVKHACAEAEVIIKAKLLDLVYRREFSPKDERLVQLQQSHQLQPFGVTTAQISAFRAHLVIALKAALKFLDVSSEITSTAAAKAVSLLVRLIRNQAVDENSKSLCDVLHVSPVNAARLVEVYRSALATKRWPVND